MNISSNGYNRFNAYLVATMQTLAVVYWVYVVGIPATYWLFASTVVNYYLLTARPAAALNFLAVVIVCLPIIEEPEFIISLLLSFALMNFFLYAFSRQLAFKTTQINDLLERDPLTGIGNRLALDDALRRAQFNCLRYGQKVSLLMLDLDHFKRINDNYGHSEGDRVLKLFTQLVEKRLRLSDRVFRFGGEEFVVLAEHTEITSAKILAEDILILVSQTNFPPAGLITVSIGIAELQSDESIDNWMKRADHALYQSKELGRNQVCISIPNAESEPVEDL